MKHEKTFYLCISARQPLFVLAQITPDGFSRCTKDLNVARKHPHAYDPGPAVENDDLWAEPSV